jgi:two-component system phosphate regulon response regulator OmpR
MKQRILIIDDDTRHRNLLANYIETQGFDTLLAANAIEMKKQRERFHCDLLILDINMPGEDGISICQRLRTIGDKTPIILLTSRNNIADKILGLEYGADDYITKPFDPTELLARVRSVLRRSLDKPMINYQEQPNQFQFGTFVLDISSRQLWCNNQRVSLSFDEFELLKILVNSPELPITRLQIALQIRSGNQENEQRNIDMLVSRLRKRLIDHSTTHQYIQTVRGIGYVFRNMSLDQSSL